MCQALCRVLPGGCLPSPHSIAVQVALPPVCRWGNQGPNVYVTCLKWHTSQVAGSAFAVDSEPVLLCGQPVYQLWVLCKSGHLSPTAPMKLR